MHHWLRGMDAPERRQSVFEGKFITAHFDRKSWTPISE